MLPGAVICPYSFLYVLFLCRRTRSETETEARLQLIQNVVLILCFNGLFLHIKDMKFPFYCKPAKNR